MTRKIKVMVLRPGDDMVGYLEFIDGSLQALRDLVGGTVEHITMHSSGSWGMYVNDNFRALGLPLNETASAIYKMATRSDDLICGVAVLVAHDDEGGDRDVPGPIITWMERVGKIVIPPDAQDEPRDG